MADEVSRARGYVVRVMVPYVGGGTATTIFYARTANPDDARRAARAMAGVGEDAEAIIISLLSESAIKELEDRYGLAEGQAMHWTKL